MPTSQPCLSRLAAYVCATPRPGHGAPNCHLVALRRRMAAALMGCTTSHWPERSIVTDTRLRHGVYGDVWHLQVALNIATVAFCCHIFQQAESDRKLVAIQDMARTPLGLANFQDLELSALRQIGCQSWELSLAQAEMRELLATLQLAGNIRKVIGRYESKCRTRNPK